MAIPWRLQRYIFREMGKTFILTSLGLTGVLSLGGGVLNMIRLGEITPSQLTRLLALIVPVAAALTLPIAALFSATSTYGRISADNEFVACRASGINLHVLLLPTIVLSLFSAAVSFAFINFVIPSMVRNLNQFVSSDIGALLQQRLNRPRGMRFSDKYFLTADEAVAEPNNPNRFTLKRVVFVEVDAESWTRYGTAREVQMQFERGEREIRASGRMLGLSFYDRKQDRFTDAEEQVIPPNVLPQALPEQIKYLTLGQLLHYRSRPEEWREVRDAIDHLRTQVGRRMVCDALWDDWRADHTVTIEDRGSRYTLRSNSEPVRGPRDTGLQFADATIEEERSGRKRSCTAKSAEIELKGADSLDEAVLQINAHDARITSEGRTVERSKDTLGPVAVDPELRRRVAELSADALMLPTSSGEGVDPLAEKRARVVHENGTAYRRIVATLHERTAFSVSVVALVILGATLAIILRGSQPIVAFGIGFIPSVLVILTIVAGKQLTQGPATHSLGLFVLWSGILFTAAADYWALTRLLRR